MVLTIEAGLGLTLAAYLVGVTAFVVRASSKATAAYDMAEKANTAATVQAAALSLYREHVATTYVDRQDLRDMEERLTSAINKLGDRLDHQKK